MIRDRISSTGDVALAWILVVCAFGCSTGGPKAPTAAELAGQDAKVIFVAPLNVASSLPVEIEGSSEIVAQTLIKYLEEHGKSARRVGFRAGRDLWIHAITQVSQTNQKQTFEVAASAYAREIAKHVDYDVLIIPTLYIQNARIRSRFAEWDGAREPIRIEGRRILSKRRKSFDSMSADVRAASLMAAVFSSNGSQIQSESRGLQLIEHVELSDGKGINQNLGYFDIKPNSPPLDDPLKIRAGIAGALAPFLPELEAAEETVEAEGAEPG